MTTFLLTTKLYIPPLRQDMVSRPHLIDRLNAGLAGPERRWGAGLPFPRLPLRLVYLGACVVTFLAGVIMAKRKKKLNVRQNIYNLNIE